MGNLALGYAFSCRTMLANLPLKKLHFTQHDCLINENVPRRKVVATRVFNFSAKLILLDIINKNVTFKLPTQRECWIGMARTYGEDFKTARRNGKWQDVDFLASNFSGYSLEFVCIHSERIIRKHVYVSGWMRDIITEKTNQGFQYYGTNIKTINDYFIDVWNEFSWMDLADVKRILKFAWKSLYLHNAYGGDTILYEKHQYKFLFYIGKLRYDSLDHFIYYIKKLRVKIRVLYNRAKTMWDGYYYFALSKSAYDKYLGQIKMRGRRRKWFTFENVYMYKIYKECKVAEFNSKYFFRIPMGTELGYTVFKRKLVSDRVEFVEMLEAKGFKTLYR